MLLTFQEWQPYKRRDGSQGFRKGAPGRWKYAPKGFKPGKKVKPKVVKKAIKEPKVAAVTAVKKPPKITGGFSAKVRGLLEGIAGGKFPRFKAKLKALSPRAIEELALATGPFGLPGTLFAEFEVFQEKGLFSKLFDTKKGESFLKKAFKVLTSGLGRDIIKAIAGKDARPIPFEAGRPIFKPKPLLSTSATKFKKKLRKLKKREPLGFEPSRGGIGAIFVPPIEAEERKRLEEKFGKGFDFDRQRKQRARMESQKKIAAERKGREEPSKIVAPSMRRLPDVPFIPPKKMPTTRIVKPSAGGPPMVEVVVPEERKAAPKPFKPRAAKAPAAAAIPRISPTDFQKITTPRKLAGPKKKEEKLRFGLKGKRASEFTFAEVLLYFADWTPYKRRDGSTGFFTMAKSGKKRYAPRGFVPRREKKGRRSFRQKGGKEAREITSISKSLSKGQRRNLGNLMVAISTGQISVGEASGYEGSNIKGVSKRALAVAEKLRTAPESEQRRGFRALVRAFGVAPESLGIDFAEFETFAEHGLKKSKRKKFTDAMRRMRKVT